MAYGIDPRLPQVINDWNSPEHWIRSDMQSALDRGEIDKAKVLSQNLATTLAPGMQAGKDAAAVDVARLGIQPNMELARQNLLPNPEGEKMLKDATAKLAPSGDGGIDYTRYLNSKAGWSLSGKDLLFK